VGGISNIEQGISNYEGRRGMVGMTRLICGNLLQFLGVWVRIWPVRNSTMAPDGSKWQSWLEIVIKAVIRLSARS